MSVTIHWFRKGLRVHDNPALLEACRSAIKVYPIFIMDPHFAKPDEVGQLRYAFLLESLTDLNRQLRELGSRLYVVKGTPEKKFPELFEMWSVDTLTFETDTEPYSKKRDKAVCRVAAESGVRVSQYSSHTLHDLDHYICKAGASPLPNSYGPFVKLFESLGVPNLPLDAPKLGQFPIADSNITEDEYGVPTLEEMGYPPLISPLKYPGGESEALRRFNMSMESKSWVAKFEKPNTSPNSLKPSTTVLSPYLKFGCISVRLFYHKLAEIYKESPGHSKPPVSLHGQLLWREFFYLCGYTVPNFDKMENNPICRQIPWDRNDEFLEAWKFGRTGYPFIDAVMTQLRTEGWIHHLARHAVACFLTRGDLWQSWESGAKVFELYLLDHDWSLNSANWMWLSCSSFFYQYFRCYSPVAFGKKTDPSGSYIRKYIPQLKNFPDKYIYEPSTAPLSIQKSAGCIIGKDYPFPIVDHKEVSKKNMSRMKAAYDVANYDAQQEKANVQKRKENKAAVTKVSKLKFSK